MKRTLSIVGQFLLFFFADFAGSFLYHPFGVMTKLSEGDLTGRSFEWDGLIMMLLVYLVVLLIATLRKRFGAAAPWSTLALACAALSGYLLRFGFVTRKW